MSDPTPKDDIIAYMLVMLTFSIIIGFVGCALYQGEMASRRQREKNEAHDREMSKWAAILSNRVHIITQEAK